MQGKISQTLPGKTFAGVGNTAGNEYYSIKEKELESLLIPLFGIGCGGGI